jgi:hypothetical protein
VRESAMKKVNNDTLRIMKYPTAALDKKFMTNLRIAVSGWLKNEKNISLKILLRMKKLKKN